MPRLFRCPLYTIDFLPWFNEVVLHIQRKVVQKILMKVESITFCCNALSLLFIQTELYYGVNLARTKFQVIASTVTFQYREVCALFYLPHCSYGDPGDSLMKHQHFLKLILPHHFELTKIYRQKEGKCACFHFPLYLPGARTNFLIQLNLRCNFKFIIFG